MKRKGKSDAEQELIKTIMQSNGQKFTRLTEMVLMKSNKIDVMVTDEKKVKNELNQTKQPPKSFSIPIFHPTGQFRSVWDFVNMFLVVYILWMVPFDVGFSWWEAPKGVNHFNTMLDIWFAIDLLLNFRTGFIKNGCVIMNPYEITWYTNITLSYFLLIS